MLIFLNQTEMFKIEYGIDYSVFNNMRKILIDEFDEVDLDKLVEILRTLHDLYIEYLRMKFYFDRSIVNTLREKLFVMYEQKMIKTANNA